MDDERARTEVRNLSAGINQHGLRDHNERLILSLIQRNGPLAGRDLSRLSGLSPQTVSVILRGLERDGLLTRGDPVRGSVGKPSVPMGLAAEGMFSVGLKIGRRSADLAVTDFLGVVRAQTQTTYRYPVPDQLMAFLRTQLPRLVAGLPGGPDARLAGIGIALPFELWNWHETVGAPEAELAAWRDVDFATAIAAFSDLPVFVENDATAACRAEFVYGRGSEFRDFAYFYVGTFVGGGIVLNNAVFDGHSGNAAAFGALPARGADGRDGQLIDAASLYRLEAALVLSGHDPARMWQQPQDWTAFEADLAPWIDRASRALARACLTVCAVVDFEAVLIDGAFPPQVRTRLVGGVRAEVARLDLRSLTMPLIGGGVMGGNARAIGAACKPVVAQFLLDSQSRPSVG